MNQKTKRGLFITLLLVLYAVATTVFSYLETSSLVSTFTGEMAKNADFTKQSVLFMTPLMSIFTFFVGTLIYQLLVSLFTYKFDVEIDKKDIRYSLYWSMLVPTVFSVICVVLVKLKLIDFVAWMGLSANATGFNVKSFLQYSLPAGLPLAVLQSFFAYWILGRIAAANKGKKVLLSFIFPGLIFWAVGVLLQFVPLLFAK
jgi:hypothetical protein